MTRLDDWNAAIVREYDPPGYRLHLFRQVGNDMLSLASANAIDGSLEFITRPMEEIDTGSTGLLLEQSMLEPLFNALAAEEAGPLTPTGDIMRLEEALKIERDRIDRILGWFTSGNR